MSWVALQRVTFIFELLFFSFFFTTAASVSCDSSLPHTSSLSS